MEFDQSGMKFISEQDGEPELRFKNEVASFLRQLEEPVSAYLCRVSYPQDDGVDLYHVALCLSTNTDIKEEMVKGASKIFHTMLGAREHLDIMFVDEAKEIELKKVCNYFASID